MQRPSGFQVTVGAALSLSVAASIAAGFAGPPNDYQILCLATATFSALWAAVATAPVRPATKKTNLRFTHTEYLLVV